MNESLFLSIHVSLVSPDFPNIYVFIESFKSPGTDFKSTGTNQTPRIIRDMECSLNQKHPLLFSQGKDMAGKRYVVGDIQCCKELEGFTP